ncbi:ABC transporter permease, partial [Proteus mirabilis]|nr:ABC transporter permease [Proteus mirabilis]
VVALLQGHLGTASSTGLPVFDDLIATFPATLELATVALVIGASLGVLFGGLCARYVGTPYDFILRLLTLIGSSVPNFWIG